MKLCITLLALLLFSSIATAQSAAADAMWEPSTAIDQYLQTHAANGRFNGNVLITRGDSILFQRSYGMADRDSGVRNADSTIFCIGSITKPFTAYAVLLLEQQGRLSLDDMLSEYFPDFPNADRVSIRHLLTHTSGIPDYHVLSDWKADSQRDITPEHTVSRVAELPYRFEPGEGFRYSNTGYILLGLIIEKVSGRSFASFIESEILAPLQLHDTGVMTNDFAHPDLAEGYTSTPREIYPAEYINYNQPFSSGNMFSSTHDLWKFTRAVMNAQLISEDKTEEIFANHNRGYGYGWGIRNYQEVKAYGHHGAMNGFSGSITYIPDGEYFICFLTNDDNTPKYTIAGDLAAIISGNDVELPKRVTVVDLTESMAETVTGDYLVREGDTLHVFVDESRLYMQETGQVRHELFPIGDHEFAFTLMEFTAVFSEFHNGKARQLEFTGNSTVVARRL